MSTTQEDIRQWLERGKQEKATHMLVVCDTYDHEDYPVYVKPGEDARTQYNAYNGPNMQRVMEVYSYALDIGTQLNEHRSFHFEVAPPPIQRREPLIVETPTVLSRVIAQVRREAQADADVDAIEREAPRPRQRRDAQVRLGTKVLDLLAKEPWLSATVIANRLRDKSSSVSSLLRKLTQEGGPLIRERGRGPRGGYGYTLRNPPAAKPREKNPDAKSRYQMILEDWL